MASRYQQVTAPEEAWKYYEAGLLFHKIMTPQGPEYYDEILFDYGDVTFADLLNTVVHGGYSYVLVEEDE